MRVEGDGLAKRVGKGVVGGLGRGFWTFFSASLLANLSDGIFQIALPLLAIGLTDEPSAGSLAAAAARRTPCQILTHGT